MNVPPSSEGQESTSSTNNHSNQSSNSSVSANSELGQIRLGERERSIISHELAPALTCIMYGRDPDTLDYLQRKQKAFPNGTAINDIFGTAVRDWPETRRKNGTMQKLEVSLTKKLSELIEAIHDQTRIRAASEVHVKMAKLKPNMPTAATAPAGEASNAATLASKGRIDILLSEDTGDSTDPTTPLAVIEVGIGHDWWRKLHQGVQYIDAISEVDPRLQFRGPTLCAVVALNGTHQNPTVAFGVVLCWRKDGGKTYRMAPLWLNFMCTLEEASEAFGRFLLAAASLADWRKTKDESYTYLSSHCCLVGDTVSVI
jgi:hypothetical protein